MDDWKTKSYVIETEEAGTLVVMPYEHPVSGQEVNRIMKDQTNEDRLKFVIEERFPGKKLQTVEVYPITIPKSEDPRDIEIVKYERGTQIGRTDLHTVYVTRGLIDGVAFYVEDLWEKVDDEVVYKIADKLEEVFND